MMSTPPAVKSGVVFLCDYEKTTPGSGVVSDPTYYAFNIICLMTLSPSLVFL